MTYRPERVLPYHIFSGGRHIASTERAEDAATLASNWGAGITVTYQGRDVAHLDVTGPTPETVLQVIDAEVAQIRADQS